MRFFCTLGLFLALFTTNGTTAQQPSGEKDIYQITLYKFTKPEQEVAIDQYLKEALLPMHHRAGRAQVGVFKPIANDTSVEKRIFVLVPFKNLKEWETYERKMYQDAEYLKAADSYMKLAYNNPAYTRMEQILLRGFRFDPSFHRPPLKNSYKEKIYELRSYESPSEAYYYNKVHMFNEGGEIELFKSLGFNAVFYAEVIAGSRMPNLMYMTSFESMDDRNNHWKSFTTAPAWEKLKSMDFYKNNVSRNETILTKATEYSDF